jgi:hypothetical protein
VPRNRHQSPRRGHRLSANAPAARPKPAPIAMPMPIPTPPPKSTPTVAPTPAPSPIPSPSPIPHRRMAFVHRSPLPADFQRRRGSAHRWIHSPLGAENPSRRPPSPAPSGAPRNAHWLCDWYSRPRAGLRSDRTHQWWPVRKAYRGRRPPHRKLSKSTDRATNTGEPFRDQLEGDNCRAGEPCGDQQSALAVS